MSSKIWFVRGGGVLFVLVFVAFPSRSHAHIELIDPPPRYGKDLQKHGPCGDPNQSPGSGVRTHYPSGETIRVRFDEFVDHRSHFRISLSVDGDQDFVDPMAFDDLNSNESVLLDGIEDNGQGPRSIEVMLPFIQCERCTLQLMQVMYEGEFDPESSLYYQCADIVIGGGPKPSDSDTGEETGDEGNEDSLDEAEATDDTKNGCQVGAKPRNRLPQSLMFFFIIVRCFRRKSLIL